MDGFHTTYGLLDAYAIGHPSRNIRKKLSLEYFEAHFHFTRGIRRQEKKLRDSLAPTPYRHHR